jgi:hypothetical protein
MELVPKYKRKVHSVAGKQNRLFIVGDFNMNPFDAGMVQPSCFFTHHNREMIDVDEKKYQTINEKLYYNPCWSLLGDFAADKSYDRGKRTGGSIFFKEQKSKPLHWYLIDQIILRKPLIEEFDSKYLKIVEKDYLVEEVLKPKIKVGGVLQPKLDHLPLRFSFTFKAKNNG